MNSSEQSAADFFLYSDNHEHAFQVTETGLPGRRRGDEYRSGKFEEFLSSWRVADGPGCIQSAIQKKVNKFYGSGLNLLVYANL